MAIEHVYIARCNRCVSRLSETFYTSDEALAAAKQARWRSAGGRRGKPLRLVCADCLVDIASHREADRKTALAKRRRP